MPGSFRAAVAEGQTPCEVFAACRIFAIIRKIPDSANKVCMPPHLEFAPDPHWMTPDEAACVQLWAKYSMPPHIRSHCRAVCSVALEIHRKAAKNCEIPVNMLQAAALLHDIAKAYTIRYGGGHSVLGAGWVRAETGNPALAQAVLFHVHWPWPEESVRARPFRLPLLIAYADKRVCHDQVVSLEERFLDLRKRYGKTAEHHASIDRHWEAARVLEQAIFALTGPV